MGMNARRATLARHLGVWSARVVGVLRRQGPAVWWQLAAEVCAIRAAWMINPIAGWAVAAVCCGIMAWVESGDVTGAERERPRP